MRTPALSLALFALTLSAFAADSPWSGTWKLDPAKSKFTGDTFTFSRSADGMMHYSNGADITYAFAPDGREYPGPFGSVEIVTAKSPLSWTRTVKRDGVVLSTDDYTLAPDQKSLAIHYSGTKPDGTSFADDATYLRVSGKEGPEGKWRCTKVKISAPNSWIISMPSAQQIKWEIPDLKGFVEGKMDGSDLPITAPQVPKNMTLSLKPTSSKRLDYVEKIDGKTVSIGYMVLAPGGKTISDFSWDAGKESEKSMALFVKQ